MPVDPGAEHEFTRDERIKTRVHKRGKKEETQVLVANDEWNVTGDYLTSEGTGFGEQGPTVDFGFNTKGAEKFSELTGHNVPEEGFSRRLGIILDGELQSAPTIQSRISNQGQITGITSEQERQATVAVLKAGSLPAALNKEPLSEVLVGPPWARTPSRRAPTPWSSRRSWCRCSCSSTTASPAWWPTSAWWSTWWCWWP